MSGGWQELRVVVPAGAVASVSAVLFRAGASGVQEDYLPGEAPPARQPWDTGAPPPRPRRRVLIAWFEEPERDTITRSLPPEASEPRWSRVVEQDWSEDWKQHFTPIRISERLTIAPPWDAPPGSLIVEPGQGFGTGQHESSRGALTLMEPVLADLQSCLDVGCGSGILALLAAREGLDTLGIDVEESAVREAAVNATRNGLHARFETTPLEQVRGRFDLVVANLHAELLARLAPELLSRCRRYLVAAGILADREHLVRDTFDGPLHLDARLTDGAWVALRYRVDP